MSTMKEALPAEERTENPSPNSTAGPTVEQQALEAIRRGLGMSGIEHDDWDFIAQRVFDSLKDAGIVKTPLTSAYFILPNGDAVNSLWVARDGKFLKFISADESCKPDLESIVRTVEPEASTQRFLSVYEPWPHRRTLAEAQKVAAAIVAEYGGSVETVRFSISPREGCVKVTACGTDISIYFQDEEGAQ